MALQRSDVTIVGGKVRLRSTGEIIGSVYFNDSEKGDFWTVSRSTKRFPTCVAAVDFLIARAAELVATTIMSVPDDGSLSRARIAAHFRTRRAP